jgi:CDP-2,3-bis-(O-geranylgeranyl)-sn-glycerol synthase
MDSLILALWFFFPAALANATPVVASMAFPKLNTPIDFGYKYRGKQLFGPNKTWRGIITGIISACLVATIQYTIWLPPAFVGKSLLFMTVLGGAIGLGALVGDCIESFFKRQASIDSGQSWFPFDQTDYIIGGLLFSLPFIILPWQVYAWVFTLYFGIHLVTVFVFYKLGVRKQPI